MIDVSSFSDIQSALDAVPSTGGVVFFPADVYVVTQTLHPKDGTMLVGEGRGTIFDAQCDRMFDVLGNDVSFLHLSFEHNHTGTWRECIRASGGGGYRFEDLHFNSDDWAPTAYRNRAIICTGVPTDVSIEDCRSNRMHFEPTIHGAECLRVRNLLVTDPEWFGLDLSTSQNAIGTGIIKNVLVSDVQIMNPWIGGVYVGGIAAGYGGGLGLAERCEMVRLSGIQVGGTWAIGGIALSLVPAHTMEDVTVDGLQACGSVGSPSIGVKLDVGGEESTNGFLRCRVDARQVSNFGIDNVRRVRPYPGCEIQQ